MSYKSEEKRKKAQALSDQAKKLVGEGKASESIELYTQAIVLSGNREPEFFLRRSSAYFELGKMQKATQDAETALSLSDGQDPNCLKILALLKQAQKQWSTASTLVERYLQLNPEGEKEQDVKDLIAELALHNATASSTNAVTAIDKASNRNSSSSNSAKYPLPVPPTVTPTLLQQQLQQAAQKGDQPAGNVEALVHWYAPFEQEFFFSHNSSPSASEPILLPTSFYKRRVTTEATWPARLSNNLILAHRFFADTFSLMCVEDRRECKIPNFLCFMCVAERLGLIPRWWDYHIAEEQARVSLEVVKTREEVKTFWRNTPFNSPHVLPTMRFIANATFGTPRTPVIFLNYEQVIFDSPDICSVDIDKDNATVFSRLLETKITDIGQAFSRQGVNLQPVLDGLRPILRVFDREYSKMKKHEEARLHRWIEAIVAFIETISLGRRPDARVLACSLSAVIQWKCSQHALIWYAAAMHQVIKSGPMANWIHLFAALELADWDAMKLLPVQILAEVPFYCDFSQWGVGPIMPVTMRGPCTFPEAPPHAKDSRFIYNRAVTTISLAPKCICGEHFEGFNKSGQLDVPQQAFIFANLLSALFIAPTNKIQTIFAQLASRPSDFGVNPEIFQVEWLHLQVPMAIVHAYETLSKVPLHESDKEKLFRVSVETLKPVLNGGDTANSKLLINPLTSNPLAAASLPLPGPAVFGPPTPSLEPLPMRGNTSNSSSTSVAGTKQCPAAAPTVPPIQKSPPAVSPSRKSSKKK